MAAAVAAMALRLRNSAFGRSCGLAGAVLDCVIPIVLVIAIAAGLGAIWLGLVH
jgi:hypothetical protein